MKTGISRWGAPKQLVCSLATSGTLPSHTPGQAYTGSFGVTGANGNITAELVSATPPLPAGWSLAVNQTTDQVTLAWPGTPPPPSPPYSLLHFDGANGSTAFPDDTGLVWTRLGSSIISTAQSRFGGASGQFAPGWGVRSAGTLSAPAGSLANDLGNWTCEFWLFLPANITTYQPILAITALSSTSLGALSLRISGGGAATNELYLGTSASSGGPTGYVVPTGQWVHIALVRDRQFTRLYANGSLRFTANGNAGAFSNEHIWIGRCDPAFGASGGFTGFVDEFRFVLGAALYTGSTYTVPTEPFVISTGVSSLPNLGFESGDVEWLKGSRWAIDTTGLKDGGTWSAKYDGPGQSTLQHVQAVPVTPGTNITASCRISKGNNREDFAGGAVVLQWLDSAYTPISFNVGNVVNTGTDAFQTSTVTATAPPGSAFVRLAASGSRDTRGRARDKVYADNFTWNYSYAIPSPPGVDYNVVIRVRDARGCQATLSQTIAGLAGEWIAVYKTDSTVNQRVLKSSTGTSWGGTATTFTAVNVSRLVGIGGSGNTLIAHTGGSQVYRSTDRGQNWTTVTTPAAASAGVKRVVNIRGRWHIPRQSSSFSIWSDDNGASWTSAVGTSVTALEIFERSSPNLKGIRNGGRNIPDSTSNGTSWNTGSGDTVFSPRSAVDLGGGVIVAIGSSATPFNQITRTTDDGATWAPVACPTSNVNHGFNLSAFGGGVIVYTNTAGEIAFSTNAGVSFSVVSGYTFPGVPSMIAFGQGRFIIVGSGGTVATCLASSPNSWSTVPSGTFGTNDIDAILFLPP